MCGVHYSNGKGSKKAMALTDEAYETLVNLIKNDFHVPVAERTREQNSVIRKYYRNKDRYYVIGNPPSLYFG